MSKETRLSFKKVAEERVGETRMMNCGEIAFIVEYADCHNITVQFKKSGELVKSDYSNFKRGTIKSRFAPSVYGVGYLGYEKSTDENGEMYESYKRWKSMLNRCYSEKYQKNHITYKDCTVCDEWLNYSNFKKWYDENYYEVDGEKMALDKDILHKGNKIYSPDTCVFVPNDINLLFTKCNKTRGKCPIGVCFDKKANKFNAQCNTFCNKKRQQNFLGYFSNEIDAFNTYKQFKEKCIKQMADEYKEKIPNKLYKAMYNYKVEITD